MTTTIQTKLETALENLRYALERAKSEDFRELAFQRFADRLDSLLPDLSQEEYELFYKKACALI